jgi:DNA-binding transcriptional LysR family regulator
MKMTNEDDISLRHLRVLTLLLEVGSLTRAAQILDTTQPTVSKILTKLRTHFADPLFVRVGLSMHPTPKAIELAQPLKELLRSSAVMRSSAASFDPRSSTREFSVIVTEVGMIQLVPALIGHLEREGRGLRLKAVPFDSRQLEVRLEAGEADLALGAFPRAAPNMRRQRLYADPFVSVVRKGHPQLAKLTRADSFLRERHIIVTSSNTGHAAHRLLDQVLNSRLESNRVHVRVPSFVTSAFVASCTDAVGTLPAKLAEGLAERLGLAVFPTPLPLPRIEIGQFWHERVHHDQGHRWFRAAIHALFGASEPRSGRRIRNHTG